MDAAVHRPAETQGREFVNSAASVEQESARPSRLKTAGAHTVSVSQGYDRWAPLYDHTPNPLLACEERYLLPLLLKLGSKQALDLACGTGRWLRNLAAQGCRSSVGVDCSAPMLRVAGAKDEIAGRLALASCEHLPFRSAIFDLAICSFALGHIGDLGSFVLELARVTKSGADVFVSDLHSDAYTRGWRVGFRDKSSAVQIEMLPRAGEEIVQAFHAEGFECLTCLPLCLGDAEREIFVRAGKVHSFAEACQLPAVLICHFKRLGSSAPAGRRSS
jgi:ubiquinone/menaquinone biosynthesis C-methylase UbiE